MSARSRTALVALAVMLVPATSFAAAREAAAGAAAAVTLVPHEIAWVRVLVLAIMWLFLAALVVGVLVTGFTTSATPVRTAAHSAVDHAHH